MFCDTLFKAYITIYDKRKLTEIVAYVYVQNSLFL